jgi:hypothetical protein
MTVKLPKPTLDTAAPPPLPHDTDFTAEGAPPPGRVANAVPVTAGSAAGKPLAAAPRSANRNATRNTNRKGPPARKGW